MQTEEGEPSVLENLEYFLSVEGPDRDELVKYLRSRRAAAFVVTADDYKIHVILQGSHAPLLKMLRGNSVENPAVLEKRQISPLKGDVTFETSSNDRGKLVSLGADELKIQDAIRAKLLDYIGTSI